ncbi:MAG: hypothetical protein ACLPYS_09720 [Vulcanimicrobiaceae bacterium]
MNDSAKTPPEDPRYAQQIDPKSGQSDEPRVDPSPSPGDGAWENELTKEDMPSPCSRGEVAESLRLDPWLRSMDEVGWTLREGHAGSARPGCERASIDPLIPVV